jgi:hypothetical protein
MICVVDGATLLLTRFTVMLLPLFAAVIAGELDTTRTRYPVPVAVPAGIVALTVPDAVAVTLPIVTGLVNDPLASDSCAVTVLPPAKVPVIVKGTEIEAP